MEFERNQFRGIPIVFEEQLNEDTGDEIYVRDVRETDNIEGDKR